MKTKTVKVKVHIDLSGYIDVEIPEEEHKALKAADDLPIDEVTLDWKDVLNQLDGVVSLAE